MPRVKKAGLKTGNGSTVVEGMGKVVAEIKPKTTKKAKDYADFYKKYSHVVKGSVREPTKEDLKVLTKCHGRVCTIKCTDCGTERVINVQDAFQVTRCPACKVKAAKEARKARRAKKTKARKTA